MGCDPQAILYYGFPIGEPGEELEFDVWDVEKAWIEKMAPPQPESDGSYQSPEWDAWREKNREWEASPENVAIWFSGCDSYQGHYVHADALKKSVTWTDCLPISPEDIPPSHEHDAQIKAFCEFAGIEYKQPGWHLAALYF